MKTITQKDIVNGGFTIERDCAVEIAAAAYKKNLAVGAREENGKFDAMIAKPAPPDEAGKERLEGILNSGYIFDTKAEAIEFAKHVASTACLSCGVDYETGKLI